MQLKEKPELNQINEQSEFLAKTYQPYRPLKEPKSVPTVDRTNLQPIQEPKSVAKVDRTNLQPLKEPKSVAKVDRTNLQPIKERKSVPTTDRTNLQPIKECESVATTLLKIILIYFPLGILKILFNKFSVVAIIMILSAIALPSFGGCGNKAKQSEAKQYVGSMNRAQQAKYADKVVFSNSLTALGLGIKTQTINYNYSAIATKNAAFSYAVSRNNNLRSYVGAVFLVPVSKAAKNENTTVSIMCEATSSGKTQPPDPILLNGDFACGDGTVVVSK
ncbi:type IV pilin-like G/H family protein [Microcoleus sp. herbarium7]|uniref:type IV pilin-like G/H family protein n=1 Tax=Microcoleus sp. herbarium7 TaxID=3055435 RepID=UPI002FD5A5DA